MTASSVFARAAELEAAGRPFAVATVVAVRRPTSARPGAAGIVHPDGTIEGWVGGSCAQPVVVREALRSLVDGQPRLLRLSKDGPGEGRRADGVIELVMTCHSGGTLEIYVEPHLARTTALGHRHDADRRRARPPGLGRGLAGHRHRPDRRGRRVPGRRACLGRRPTSAASTPTRRRMSWSRRQGIWDEEAVAARADPRGRPTSGSSPRRHVPRVVRDWLREETTIGDERIAALRAPAGLDLGRRDRRGGRAVDPRRAGPGAPRPGGLRGLARSGDGRRRRSRPRSRSSRSSTTSSCSTRSAG